ncbi:MAG: glycosyl transferase, partial [Pseudomonadota bacterium]|nr:glycosyl transferase [Pseudomonadota bacterium]
RLPSFPRYGSSEYPFAVALKTGTSQGYRDAWTLAWSRDYVVGVWVGRGDAGPMTRLGGGRAAAGLAQDVMLHLHGSLRTDLVAGEFAPPPGRVETELCARTGRPAGHECAERLTEWVRPAAAPPLLPETRLAITRPGNDLHVWRNPNLPAMLNRLVLHASVEPKAAQIVWLLNGQPISTAGSEAPLIWTMTPGHHRFQIRLATQNALSTPVHVVVE